MVRAGIASVTYNSFRELNGMSPVLVDFMPVGSVYSQSIRRHELLASCKAIAAHRGNCVALSALAARTAQRTQQAPCMYLLQTASEKACMPEILQMLTGDGVAARLSQPGRRYQTASTNLLPIHSRLESNSSTKRRNGNCRKCGCEILFGYESLLQLLTRARRLAR